MTRPPWQPIIVGLVTITSGFLALWGLVWKLHTEPASFTRAFGPYLVGMAIGVAIVNIPQVNAWLDVNAKRWARATIRREVRREFERDVCREVWAQLSDDLSWWQKRKRLREVRRQMRAFYKSREAA